MTDVDLSVTFENDPLIFDERQDLLDEIAKGHDYQFVGRVGCFIPVKRGGGLLMRQNGNSYAFATGSSGHRWLEAESVNKSDIDNIDISYHRGLVDDAICAMSKYGDVEWFLSDDISPEPLPDFMNIPTLPAGLAVDEMAFAS